MKKLKAYARTISIIVMITFMLASCAVHPRNITPRHVSPIMYSDRSCNQLRMEQRQVRNNLAALTSKQALYSNVDAAALCIGLVLFWPALFFMINGDYKSEISQLKGECEAIELRMDIKKCFG